MKLNTDTKQFAVSAKKHLDLHLDMKYMLNNLGVHMMMIVILNCYFLLLWGKSCVRNSLAGWKGSKVYVVVVLCIKLFFMLNV